MSLRSALASRSLSQSLEYDAADEGPRAMRIQNVGILLQPDPEMPTSARRRGRARDGQKCGRGGGGDQRSHGHLLVIPRGLQTLRADQGAPHVPAPVRRTASANRAMRLRRSAAAHAQARRLPEPVRPRGGRRRNAPRRRSAAAAPRAGRPPRHGRSGGGTCSRTGGGGARADRPRAAACRAAAMALTPARRHQRLCVGMARRLEDRLDRAELHDAPPYITATSPPRGGPPRGRAKTRISVRPSSRFRSSSRLRICARIDTSRAETGSSPMSTCGPRGQRPSDAECAGAGRRRTRAGIAAHAPAAARQARAAARPPAPGPRRVRCRGSSWARPAGRPPSCAD